MPRQSRIDAPGALHHVMIRGIERREIFQDDKDRESFLDRLGGILLESSTPCYAWSLLSNHAHFLLRTGQIPISRVMRKLLTGYAVTFNRRIAMAIFSRTVTSPSCVRKMLICKSLCGISISTRYVQDL